MNCEQCRAKMLENPGLGQKPPDDPALQLHLQQCDDCRVAFAEEQALTRLLQSIRPLYPVPRSLQDKARVLLAAPQSSSDATAAGRLRAWTAKGTHPEWRSTRTRWNLALGATAAAGVAASLFVMFGPGGPSSAPADSLHRAEPWIRSAASNHQRLTRGALPVQYATASVMEATAWVNRQLPLAVRIPDAPIPEALDVPFRFKGASCLAFGSNTAALFVWERDGSTVGLAIAPARLAFSGGKIMAQAPGLTFYSAERDGVRVVTWTSHNLTYALTSSTVQTARESCLVCHQSMKDWRDFAHVNGNRLPMKAAAPPAQWQ